MLNVRDVVVTGQSLFRRNSTTILTALGVSGTITTAYLTAKASFKASRMLHEDQGHLWKEPVNKKEVVKFVWKVYIPPTISGVVTIGCIIGATRIGNKKTAALTAAYSLSERALTEYKDKVIETFGERKEQKIRDDIAQDKVRANAPGREVILSGAGHVLCCELYTGRYFNSDMESLRKAQNELNAKLIRDNEASLSDFYYMIGLPYTSYSSNSGWNSDKLMEMQFSTVLTEDGRPCLAFEYNYIIPF